MNTAVPAAARQASAGARVPMLGDARSGKFAANLTAFARALRRAGIPVDASRIALAQQAVAVVGVARREDLAAALEAVLLSREQDRGAFGELFDAFFRDPKLANRLLAQMLPRADGQARPPRERPRVCEALAPQRSAGAPGRSEQSVDLDAAMSASRLARLKEADFNQLSASEYRLVEQLVQGIALPLPVLPARRSRAGVRGARLHWRGSLQAAGRSGGEVLRLVREERRGQRLPLLVLLDVSGSMERYARLLLAFLHAATRRARVGDQSLPLRRDVFAFGTALTDLTPAFALADTDAMLREAGRRIQDFAGGTRLGESLAELRARHARRLVGRRTLVLIVSDGLDTGEPAQLVRELAWLKRHSRRILWLNPLLRFDGYAPLAQGAQALHQAADAMLAVHNVTRLQQLAAAMAALLRR